MNKAAVRLLERGSGIAQPTPDDRIGSSLDHLFGTWSEKEAARLLDSIQACEQIDAEMWE